MGNNTGVFGEEGRALAGMVDMRYQDGFSGSSGGTSDSFVGLQEQKDYHYCGSFIVNYEKGKENDLETAMDNIHRLAKDGKDRPIMILCKTEPDDDDKALFEKFDNNVIYIHYVDPKKREATKLAVQEFQVIARLENKARFAFEFLNDLVLNYGRSLWVNSKSKYADYTKSADLKGSVNTYIAGNGECKSQLESISTFLAGYKTGFTSNKNREKQLDQLASAVMEVTVNKRRDPLCYLDAAVINIYKEMFDTRTGELKPSETRKLGGSQMQLFVETYIKDNKERLGKIPVFKAAVVNFKDPDLSKGAAKSPRK